MKLPRWFNLDFSTLDTAVATLQQVSSHIKSGITYIRPLATECATALVKIAPIVADASLDRKEFQVKRKSEKRALAKDGELKLDADALSLDIWEYSSGSGSDGDGSVRDLRGILRRDRVRFERKTMAKGRLKRGDDIVEKLLEMRVCQGKSKYKARRGVSEYSTHDSTRELN